MIAQDMYEMVWRGHWVMVEIEGLCGGGRGKLDESLGVPCDIRARAEAIPDEYPVVKIHAPPLVSLRCKAMGISAVCR